MKAYPYIGKCEENNLVVLFTSFRSGTTLHCGSSDIAEKHKYETGFNEREFKSITAEYLTNTCGKVESKEHAEFIVKLAKVNNINFIDRWYHGLIFCFYIDGKGNLLLDFMDSSYLDDEKLITIPLPTKKSFMHDFNSETPMPEVKEPKKVSVNDIQINVNNNTDSVVQVTKSDDESNIFIHVNDLPKESKEWPAVGDEVLICKNVNLLELHRFNGKQCKVIGICEHGNEKVLTLSHKSCGLAAMNMGEWIKKPPTPKDELDRKLYDFFQCNSEEDLAEAIINGEIEGLEYKPQ